MSAEFPVYNYVTDVPVVVDGDTVHVNIDMGFHCWIKQSVRLGGINAPELSTPEGLAVRDVLVHWIEGFVTGTWHIQTFKTGEDKYGRYLATVFAPDGTSMNQWLLDTGHARAWDGKGSKPV